MNATTPNDLDETTCADCGGAAWFDATCTGWTHEDPERDAGHEVRPEEAPEMIVRACRILGTERVALSVWEPSTYTGPHSTVSTLSLGRGCWGLLTSRRCERADAMPPGSEERRAAYEGWRAAAQAKAVRVIVDTLGPVGEPSPIWRGEVHTTVAALDAAGWSSILDAPARAVVRH